MGTNVPVCYLVYVVDVLYINTMIVIQFVYHIVLICTWVGILAANVSSSCLVQELVCERKSFDI